VDNPPLPDAARHLGFIHLACAVTTTKVLCCFVVLFSTMRTTPIELMIQQCLVDWNLFFHECPEV
jgi:hypothetical protein